MDTSRRFDSKVGAELWLEREGVEGQPILLQTYTDELGRVIREEWAIRTEEGDESRYVGQNQLRAETRRLVGHSTAFPSGGPERRD